MFGESIIRQRATAAANVYSGESDGLDWTTPSELTISGVAVAPASSNEPLEVGRAPVDTDLTLYLPDGADVRPLDRVVVRDITYEVQGERGDWPSPYTTWRPGAVVQVRKVTG